MKIHYFAWMRERIGRDSEDLDLPAHVKTVADLIAWLRARGGAYDEALGDPAIVRVAVNQSYAKFDQVITAFDEVAIFPPVTGG